MELRSVVVSVQAQPKPGRARPKPADRVRLPALQWPEFRIALAFASLAASLWFLVWLASEVLEGNTRGLDRTILLLFRDGSDPANPLGPIWFEQMVRDLTALGSIGVLTLVTAVAVMFLALVGRRRAALVVVGCIGGGWLITSVLKHAIERPRPDLVPHGAVVFSSSFPSSHAVMSAVVYLTLAALLSRVQPDRRVKACLMLWAVVLTLLIGISRIYLAVHWPSDVLAGWTVGAAWALGCWLLMRFLQRRHAVADAGPALAVAGEAEPLDRASW